MRNPVLYATTSPLGIHDLGDHERSELLNILLFILNGLLGGALSSLRSMESLLEGWPVDALLRTTCCLSGPQGAAEDGWSPRQPCKGHGAEVQGRLRKPATSFSFLAHVICCPVWRQEQFLYKEIYRSVIYAYREY